MWPRVRANRKRAALDEHEDGQFRIWSGHLVVNKRDRGVEMESLGLGDCELGFGEGMLDDGDLHIATCQG